MFLWKPKDSHTKMPKCDPSNQENDSKSTISNSSEENKSEKVNDNEEISSKTEEQSSSTLFQSIHECGTPLQNCTEILNEILTTSLHLSDNDCVKSDVNSAYLSVKTSAEDLTSNLTSFKTFASEIKEASTVTEFLSGKEFLSPKESKTATKIVAPILTVKESKIGLYQILLQNSTFRGQPNTIPRVFPLRQQIFLGLIYSSFLRSRAGFLCADVLYRFVRFQFMRCCVCSRIVESVSVILDQTKLLKVDTFVRKIRFW